MIHTLFPYVAKDLVFYGITTLSTTILSIQNIYNFILNHKDTELKIYTKEMEKTDMHFRLNVISAVIKNLIENYSENNENNENKFLINLDIDDYDFVSFEKHNITLNIEEPVKIALYSTMEIIIKLHKIFDKIHTKILQRENQYFKFLYKLNIQSEISEIIFINDIFDKRTKILFETIKIYLR